METFLAAIFEVVDDKEPSFSPAQISDSVQLGLYRLSSGRGGVALADQSSMLVLDGTRTVSTIVSNSQFGPLLNCFEILGQFVSEGRRFRGVDCQIRAYRDDNNGGHLVLEGEYAIPRKKTSRIVKPRATFPGCAAGK